MKLSVLFTIAVFSFWFNGCPPKPTPTPPPTPTPVPHAVKPDMELLITSRDVVDSIEANQDTGAFGIKTLLTNMAPQGKTAKDMVLSFFKNFETDQVVNQPFKAPKITQVADIVKKWKLKDTGNENTPDDQWNMNFANAPFRLLAIVNRLDLRSKLETGTVENAGEGRFVFGVTDPNGGPTNFTIIFEYEQPAKNQQELAQWAQDWHHLGTFASFSPEYIAALRAVTNKFAGRNTMPAKPNGSALNQIRTDHLFGAWELREFHLDAATGLIQAAMTKQAPDNLINHTQALTDYVNLHAADIKVGQHQVPQFFPETSTTAFRGGNSVQDGAAWHTVTPVDPKARQMFSFNTCNGCHTVETGNAGQFFHIHPRATGTEATKSAFLSGEINVPDPAPSNPGAPFVFNEMEQRTRILTCEAGEGLCDQTLLKAALETRSKRVH